MPTTHGICLYREGDVGASSQSGACGPAEGPHPGRFGQRRLTTMKQEDDAANFNSSNRLRYVFHHSLQHFGGHDGRPVVW